MTKQYSVIWSRTAEYDLESIIDYIAEDSPFAARNVLAKIKQKSSLLYSYPARGRIVPELKEFNILQYREIIIDPWRVIYKVTDDKVFVMAVIDARRNVEDILLERMIGR
ncbi:type II toxin-antitoxin system RelE/ParE family toxin [bacterium]|nr:type II toxin-antitoxin system RelE/ParE family toxin [bacterium]